MAHVQESVVHMDDVSPDFDSIKHRTESGEDVWSARDLAPLLGYKQWRNFQEAIDRAIIACQQVGNQAEEWFIATSRTIRSGRGREQPIPDYLLTRYACYLIALNGDPRKFEVAAAQNYFIKEARENELRKLEAAHAQYTKRIVARERISESQKKLTQVAQQVGVRKESVPRFHNAGYEGMYDGRDVEAIKGYKGIDPKEDLLDRMGRAELVANEFRITQTEMSLYQQGYIGEENAIDTHRIVGQIVRTAISESSGVMPEDLRAEPSLKPVLNQRKRQRKNLSAPPDQSGSDQKT